MLARSLTLTLLLIQTGCVASQYHPAAKSSAKFVYHGRNRTLVVGDRAEEVNVFNGDYVDLFQGQAREYASDSHTSAILGFSLGLVAAVGTIAAIFIPEAPGDLFQADTARSQVGLGVLLGSLVVGSVGGHFQVRSEVQLNDAVNHHNDHH